MHEEIILIGPMQTGKSTQGKLLAEKLGLPQCSMDAVRWKYYEEIGYSQEEARRIFEKEGFDGLYRYWKPFEAHAVERLLEENHDCVIDFGAGHSVFEDETLFARVRQALAPYKNVVLLLPSPDPEECVSILNARTHHPDAPPEVSSVNAHFVKHPSNRALARHVVYTRDKTPEETRDEILEAIDRAG